MLRSSGGKVVDGKVVVVVVVVVLGSGWNHRSGPTFISQDFGKIKSSDYQ